MLGLVSGRRFWMATLLVALFAGVVNTANAEQLPAALRGTWRVTRILPTTNTACWTPEDARSLVGSTLSYSQNWMRWRGGVVVLQDIDTRRVSAEGFRKENDGGAEPASFEQIGVRAPALTDVDLQHEDADVLPASTEIPGDSVLMVAPNRIVVSACGVYYEATRAGSRANSRVQRVSARGVRDGSGQVTGR